MKIVVCLLLLATIIPTSFAAESVVMEIIARVNDSIITTTDLQRSREQAQAEVRERAGNSAEATSELQERDKNLLRDLIDQQLLTQKAKDLGVSADTELVKRLDAMRKQMNLETMEELEKAAQAQGVSYEDFKQNMRNQILTQQVIQREVGSKVSITNDEIKQFYEQHRSELERPEQVRMSEILVATKPADPKDENSTSDPGQVEAAQKKANDILAQLKSGAKFEEVAQKNSDGPTAAQGGDLGYFRRGMLAKELEDKTFSMKPGEVSGVIRTKQGFIVLKVTEHPPAGVPPLKDVEPQVQEALYMRKMQPALRAYLTRLREDAFIDIKAGFIDTGASPNQTKPIMASAEQPGEKEKETKKKKRFLLF